MSRRPTLPGPPPRRAPQGAGDRRGASAQADAGARVDDLLRRYAELGFHSKGGK